MHGSVIGRQSISAVWDEKVRDKAYCRYCALPRLQSPAVPNIHTPSRRIKEQAPAPLGLAPIAGPGQNSVAGKTRRATTSNFPSLAALVCGSL